MYFGFFLFATLFLFFILKQKKQVVKKILPDLTFHNFYDLFLLKVPKLKKKNFMGQVKGVSPFFLNDQKRFLIVLKRGTSFYGKLFPLGFFPFCSLFKRLIFWFFFFSNLKKKDKNCKLINTMQKTKIENSVEFLKVHVASIK